MKHLSKMAIQTTIPIRPKQKSSLELLQKKAERGDKQAFVQLIEGTEWAEKRPEEILQTIDLALSLEMASLAIKLAQQGHRLFPNHPRFQQTAEVLSPPRVRSTTDKPATGVKESMSWFGTHAQAYRGRWVAVREGQLVGTAASFKELVALIGRVENTFISKIP